MSSQSLQKITTKYIMSLLIALDNRTSLFNMLSRCMEMNYPPVQWKLYKLARVDGFKQKEGTFSLGIRKTQESGEALA